MTTNETTDKKRLQIFIYSVDLCNEILREIGAISEDGSLIPFILNKQTLRDNYGKMIITAMLLRKYYADRDKVNLRRTIKSILKLLPQNTPRELKENLEKKRENILKDGDNKSQFSQRNSKSTSGTDIFYTILYGAVLHGDPERLEELRSWPSTAYWFALWESNVYRLKRVRETYKIIKENIDIEYLNWQF